jgi:hypothetical protein
MSSRVGSSAVRLAGAHRVLLERGWLRIGIIVLLNTILPPICRDQHAAQDPAPIGPYSHIAKVDRFITNGGTAGVDPATGQLAGLDVRSQARQILVGSDLEHVACCARRRMPDG